MAIMKRYRAVWTGFPGGPGVTHFYGVPADLEVPSVRQFFANIVAFIPQTVSIQVENVGDLVEATDGSIVGSWSEAAVAAVPGSSGGAYSAPSGASVTWKTNVVVAGRRLQGRTFLVPLSGASYATDGSLEPGAQAGIESSAVQLFGAMTLYIWHRPTIALPASGIFAPVVSARVPDRAAVLRSRRP